MVTRVIQGTPVTLGAACGHAAAVVDAAPTVAGGGSFTALAGRPIVMSFALALKWVAAWKRRSGNTFSSEVKAHLRSPAPAEEKACGDCF